jgi:hypothetical protein
MFVRTAEAEAPVISVVIADFLVTFSVFIIDTVAPSNHIATNTQIGR